MLASWIGRGTVFFIAVCVLLLFFFPLAQGPFQATNGPTTAFRAHMVLLILISMAAYIALGILVPFSKWTVAQIANGLLAWAPTSGNLTVVAHVPHPSLLIEEFCLLFICNQHLSGHALQLHCRKFLLRRDIMKKAMHSFFLAVSFALLLSGCHHNPQLAKTNPPTPPKPSLAPSATLTVSPASVPRGQTAQLVWNTQNASDITIEGIGTVVASGHKQITASESTTYHLVAKGDGGSAEANARLTVTVPEQKAAGLTDQQLFAQNVKDIFFNYDNAEIRGDEQSVLDANAQFLASHPDWRLMIEGHCDERGSEEYNLALGQTAPNR